MHEFTLETRQKINEMKVFYPDVKIEMVTGKEIKMFNLINGGLR